MFEHETMSPIVVGKQIKGQLQDGSHPNQSMTAYKDSYIYHKVTKSYSIIKSTQTDMSSYTAQISPYKIIFCIQWYLLVTGAYNSTSDKITISSHRIYFCCTFRAHVSLDRHKFLGL